MRLNVTKEWCARMADKEEGYSVCAGVSPTEMAWKAFDEWMSANADRLGDMDIVDRANLFCEESAALASGEGE